MKTIILILGSIIFLLYVPPLTSYSKRTSPVVEKVNIDTVLQLVQENNLLLEENNRRLDHEHQEDSN